MGFPGIGWLFAGFPFTASILLTAGPAIAWAVIPVAFTPFGQGPLREIGWKVELAYLPLSALVSSAALYRAHARRRARLFGKPPRTGRRLFAFDRGLQSRYVVGADEAGRGCLAGPLVAAAVLIDYERLSHADRRALSGLYDSKQMTEERRLEMYPCVLRAAERVSVVIRSPAGASRTSQQSRAARTLSNSRSSRSSQSICFGPISSCSACSQSAR